MSSGEALNWRILREDDDVTDEMEAWIAATVEWFDGEPTMPTDDFIDRFCKSYGGNGEGPNDFDIDDFDTPAVRKIMRIARRIRKEQQS